MKRSTRIPTRDRMRDLGARLASSLRHSALLELALILLWAMLAGQEYLNMNPNVWPSGNENPLSIQSNYQWGLLTRCGSCALWDGSLNGGFPALVDLQSALLHPLVSIPTLLFGVINGSKVTLLLSLWLGGLAVWWLARLLNLGWAPRMWAALLAVVSGSLTGKAQIGLVTLVLSTASAWLVIPAVLNLAQRGTRQAAMVLALTLALAFLSGQGYMQIGLAFCIFPAALILLVDLPLSIRPSWKLFLLALGLAGLIAAVLLVPLMHFSSQWVKGLDPDLTSAQPVEYLFFNLVVRSPEFYIFHDTLGKIAIPYLFINYVGWVPILLLGFTLRLVPRERLRSFYFLLIAILLAFFTGSAILPKFLLGALAPNILFGMRSIPLIAALAGPLVIALAAWGVDLLVKNGRLVFNLRRDNASALKVQMVWVLLAVPLIWALVSAYQFSQNWLITASEPKEVQVVLNHLKQEEAQWIYPAFDGLFWTPSAISRGLKMVGVYKPWSWTGRSQPPAMVDLLRDAPQGTPAKRLAGVYLVEHPDVDCAVISSLSERFPCRAKARGGDIDVICDTQDYGVLTVSENAWNGWFAWRDGKPLPLLPAQWLQVDAPPGSHVYTFRYLPWDVLLGALLSLAGLVLAGLLWVKSPPRPHIDAGSIAKI